MLRLLTVVVLFSGWLTAATAEAPADVPQLRPAKRPAPDEWATQFVQFPPTVATNLIRLAGFETLRAEGIAGKIRIAWTPASLNTNDTVTAWASMDEAGHWPARDWRPYSMTPRGPN